jgi:hypothetical protein
MRASITITALASILAAGALFVAVQRHYEVKIVRAQAKTWAQERQILLKELGEREDALRQARELSAATANPVPVTSPVVDSGPEVAELEPEVTVGERGKKSYFFPKLHDPQGRVIAREAQFRELLGLSKLSFRTSEGTRYFGLDDLHPVVLSSLGFNADVLKRRMAEELAQMQLLGAQARLRQELATQAAQQAAARETAAAERSRAEAALREAQAKERLASVAEGIAANPPRPPQVNVRVVNIETD